TLTAMLMAARLCRARFDGAEGRVRFILFAWCPLLAWELSGQVHNDALLVVCLVGFVDAALAGRETRAMAFAILGTTVKLAALPVAGLYIVMILRRSPARGVLFGAALVAVTIVSMLPFWHGLETLSGMWTNIAPVAGHSTRSIADLCGQIGELHSEAAKELTYRAFSIVGLAAALAVALLCI